MENDTGDWAEIEKEIGHENTIKGSSSRNRYSNGNDNGDRQLRTTRTPITRRNETVIGMMAMI